MGGLGSRTRRGRSVGKLAERERLSQSVPQASTCAIFPSAFRIADASLWRSRCRLVAVAPLNGAVPEWGGSDAGSRRELPRLAEPDEGFN